MAPMPSNAPGTGLFRFLTILVGVLIALVLYLNAKGEMPNLGPKPTPTPAATTTVTPTTPPSKG